MATKKPPPALMRLSEVPDYVFKRTGRRVSRQTIYNWASKGREGVKLRTTLKIGQMFTLEGWVDAFID